MAKKISIIEDSSASYSLRLWGIGSSYPVWKTGNELNRLFSLDLKRKEIEHLNPILNKDIGNSLFEVEELQPYKEDFPFYESIKETFTIAFFENPLKISPKETHIFSFLFVIIQETETPLTPIEAGIYDTIVITEIAGISHHKQYKKLIQWIHYLL